MRLLTHITMAIKKSELYSSLWASCDELRGGMDASQYKDYVLTLLFVKYISDKYKNQIFGAIKVPKGASFEDMVKLVGTANIGDDVNKLILNPIKEANNLSDFPDFNDEGKLGKGKDLVDTVSNLILIFNSPDLDFSGNSAEGDDILGDAYEYLMRHFATESGKSKGQFYTPAEVSRVLAKVLGISNDNSTAQTTAYDPTCGSGSLLLKVADEAGKSITLYGQEKDTATANLARMNMILHNNPTAEIHADNTLSRPFFKNGSALQAFDYVVANPPFSLKNWSNGVQTDNDEFDRFDGFGVPPEKNGDYAFLLHILRSMKSAAKAAVVLPHGVLFRGNAEAEIRKNIIKKGYIKGIIGLPPNLFYGTGIPACIIVLDKENAAQRKGIFMIDASKYFVKDGDKNRLREQDIRKITDVFTNFSEVEKYSRMVPLSEIADDKNDYNLNIPRYIDSQEREDVQDIFAHIHGGIPKSDVAEFGKYWKVYPGLKNALYEDISEKYVALKVPKEEIKTTIFSHPEFRAYAQTLEQQFEEWKTTEVARFVNFSEGINPKEEIQATSRHLLEAFAGNDLTDPYDLYQHLMSYWNETMQDDFYTISMDGWKAGNQWERQIVKGKKGKDGKAGKDKIVEGLEGITGKLIPAQLLVDTYFGAEMQHIESLRQKVEELKAAAEELVEENSGEDSAFSEFENVTTTVVKKYLQDHKKAKTTPEHKHILEEYLQIFEDMKTHEQEIKAKLTQLEGLVTAKYESLTETEIKQLVTERKWMKHLVDALHSEQERLSQHLSQRVKELAERYETTLPQITKNTHTYEARVMQHLNLLTAQ